MYFNPNFVKIEENEMYIEKPDEFEEIDENENIGHIDFGFNDPEPD